MLIILLFLLVFGILGVQLFQGGIAWCNDTDEFIKNKDDCQGWYWVDVYNEVDVKIGVYREQREQEWEEIRQKQMEEEIKRQAIEEYKAQLLAENAQLLSEFNPKAANQYNASQYR